MTESVVDTNVPVVANGRGTHADPDCVMACIQALTHIKQDGIIVLDDQSLILTEYRNNLNMSGQSGAGDLFMRWVWTVQADVTHCRQVRITPLCDDSSDFVEFPDDPDLAGFDRSDRKFVAVALASGATPELLNATDSDWANHYAALKRHGVNLRFLCPQHTCPEG